MRVHAYFVFRQTVCVQLNFNPVKFCPTLWFTFIFNRCHNEVNINKRLYESLNCSVSKPVVRHQDRCASCVRPNLRHRWKCINVLNISKWWVTEPVFRPMTTGLASSLYTFVSSWVQALEHSNYILNFFEIWVNIHVVHTFVRGAPELSNIYWNYK
jgi:hypothetical protein